MKTWTDERGSIIVEAAIVMPLFLSFMVAMICFIQIAIAEMALQHAVSETTKQVAAHMYPAYLLAQTKTGDQIADILQDIDAAKEAFSTVSTFSDDYAALMPDSVVTLLSMSGQGDQMSDHVQNYLVLQLMLAHVDERLLHKRHLNVSASQVPNVFVNDEAYFGITAQYDINLFIPFFRQTLTISKTAHERAWIGN